MHAQALPPASPPMGLWPGCTPLPGGELPASKSEAIRMLLCASLARGTTRLAGHLAGDDVEAALACVAILGTPAQRRGNLTEVTGRPPTLAATPDSGAPVPRQEEPGRSCTPSEPLPVGESGTLARLCLALLAFCPAPGYSSAILPGGSLASRPSGPLTDALRLAGARVETPHAPTTSFPRRVVSAHAPEHLFLKDPVSSQEVSALLMALAALGGPRRLTVSGPIPSRPYVELTRRILVRFGARTHEESPGEWTVRGPLVAPALTRHLEPDASGAAVLLTGACLSGTRYLVPDLLPGSLQGDLRIVEHLAAFGCEASVGPEGARASGPPRHGIHLDLCGEPDLAPVLVAPAAAVALGRWGPPAPSRLEGLASLTIKESDRLSVLARGLRSLGLSTTTDGQSLDIAPGRAPDPGGLTLDPAGDHRMAFAFALLGLLHPDLKVSDPGCVSKSWPGFWAQWSTPGDPGGSTAGP